MTGKVASISHCTAGTISPCACTVKEGARKAGAEVRWRKVHALTPDEAIASHKGWSAHRLESQDVEETTNDDRTWATAISFGTPTRYGLPTAQRTSYYLEHLAQTQAADTPGGTAPLVAAVHQAALFDAVAGRLRPAAVAFTRALQLVPAADTLGGE